MAAQYCEFIKSSIKFWDPLWIFSHKVNRVKKRRPNGLLNGGTESLERINQRGLLVFEILLEDEERQDRSNGCQVEEGSCFLFPSCWKLSFLVFFDCSCNRSFFIF